MSTRPGELVVISGPSRGVRFNLASDVMRIGRDKGCEIHLEDEAASRVNSEIFKRNGKLFLRDMKSTNGTFCNDARISEIELSSGDRISLGDSVLHVQYQTAPAANAPQIVFAQDDATAQVRLSLNLDDSRFLDFKDGMVPVQAHRNLTRLYEFLEGIDGVLHVPSLLERALDEFLKIFPASRGLILLMTPEGVPGLQAARSHESLPPGQTILITRPMLQILLEKKESCLASPAHENVTETVAMKPLAGNENGGESVVTSLAAPLRVKDKVVGMIYLDSLNPAQQFTQADLKMCSVMALKLASALENARQFTELLNHTEFHTTVMRALSSGIMVTDMKARVQYLNRAAQDLIDKHDTQMLGRPLTDFADMGDFNQAVQNTLANGKPEDRYEMKFKTATGVVTLGLSAAPLNDGAGNGKGVVVTFRNLGALRKLEEQVRRSHHLEALGQMAAGVAHEIRNPLNSIRGFAQLVEENEQTTAVSKEYLKIILEEVERMNNIVQNMLDFARQRQLTLLPVSLPKLLSELVRDMQVETTSSKVALDILQPGEALPNVLGNNAKLRQVFRNIILNAIQACQPGGSVTIGFRPGFSQVVDPKSMGLDKPVSLREVIVHINDTGCGMTPEIQRKIFDPFFTQKDTGTGLGLSITQKIIEQHQGRIEVKSEPGVGSTFSLHFPAVKES